MKPKTLPQFTDELKQRFWSNVPIGDSAQCWEWAGHISNKGYGVIKIRQVGYLAHRIALFLSVGINEHKTSACHKCDNPKCCNPSHLFWGTHRENMLDMIAKNRANRPRGDRHFSRINKHLRPRGERHALAKLTEQQVREIRAMHKSGVTHARIAARFPISRRTASAITTRKIWAHVSDENSQSEMQPKLQAKQTA